MKILYATDGFDPAIQAGQLVEKVADRSRLDITVMSVTHSGIPAPEHAPLMMDTFVNRREDTIAIVDSATEKLRAAGFRANGHTAEGHPGEEIVRAVEDDWYDLVIVGSGRRSWLGSRLLGSVSSYVLQSSPWSVMIVHDSLPMDKTGRLLVGTDGSRGASLTIQTLARLVDPSRVEIDVLSVARELSPAFLPVPGGLYIPLAEEDRIAKRLRDEASRNAEEGAQRLRDLGFQVNARVGIGDAVSQLLDVSRDEDFDLVAVGSRGLGPIRRALLGSVSDHLARHARASLIGRRLGT